MEHQGDFEVRVLRDEMDAATHQKVLSLWLRCYPESVTARWVHQPHLDPQPDARYLAFAANGDLAGYIAVYEKYFGSAAGDLACLGISRVAVDPDYRGRGLVRLLLKQIHADGAARDFDFSTLFGRREIYGSSGYRPQDNVLRFQDLYSGDLKVQPMPNFQVAALRGQNWPAGEIDLRGALF